MRGFVMVLMAFDHASLFFNAGRVAHDSAAGYAAGDPLPALQFFVRWITHLCAPTFVFLAGTALALSAARRGNSGPPSARFDRDLVLRGCLLVVLEVFGLGQLAPTWLVSVLTAIGVSMILMVPLRRLPDVILAGAALAWFAAGEWVTSLFWQGQGNASVPVGLLVGFHYGDEVHILYPVLHWLPMMMLGWVFGRHLLGRREDGGSPIGTLVAAGALALAVFAVVRAVGGYGNMFLPADDASWVQWLHVSKYPPSLAFVALELGLMAWCLAGFLWLESRVVVRRNGLLLVLGQTALFFYLLHFLLLGLAGSVLGRETGGIAEAAIAAAVVIAFLYPFCRRFRSFKQARPRSWVRLF